MKRFIFCIIYILSSLIWFWNGMIFERNNAIQTHIIQNIKSKVKNINAGGCGYFAMKLYERLNHNQYEIVCINNFNHVAIREKRSGIFIDADGYRDSLSYQLRYQGCRINTITYDSLKREVNRINNWNRSFNRNDTVIINEFIYNL